MVQFKSNQAWLDLCELTTKLLPQFPDRPYAFEEACRQRPDLEARAVDPRGDPVSARPRPKGWRASVRPAAQTARPPLAQLDALAKRMAREKHIAFHEAYGKVLATTEAAKLYDAYLASKRNGKRK
jgi:hypothetical protein